MTAQSPLKEKLLNKSQRQQDDQPQYFQSSGFIEQSLLLIYKNFVLTIKNPKNLIFLIITPFLLSAFMAGFQYLARQNGKKVLPDPLPKAIPKFPRCITYSTKECMSLSYMNINVEGSQDKNPLWVDYTLDFIKNQASIPETQIERLPTLYTEEDMKKFYDSLVTTPNRTQIGLMFCAGIPTDPKLKLFCQLPDGDNKYYLVLNKTDSLSVIFHDIMEPLPIDPVALSLKYLIDNAILNFHLQQKIITPKDKQNKNQYDYRGYQQQKNFQNQETYHIQYQTSQFPVGPNRYIDNYDIVTQVGAFYYLITPLFAFLFIQSQIVRQKQYKLRQGLNIFGASHGAYWISWFVIANIYSLVSAVFTYLAGLTFQFGFFTDTPAYIIIFFMMYPFTLAMQMMSFWLSTLSPTVKAANAVSYGIVLFAIVVESFVSNPTLLQFLFTENASTLVNFLKYFLCFYPPFSFTKIFTNITTYSGYHFDIATRKWQSGIEPYTIDIFAQESSGKLPFGGDNFVRYSDLLSMCILFGDALIFIIFAWYCDHVNQSNRGRGQSFIFPIKDIYNFINKILKKRQGQSNRRLRNQAADLNIDAIKNPNYLVHDEQQSTIKERNRVYKNAKAKIPALGIRIKALSKTFKSMCSKQRVQAIRNFNLQIQPNQLMGLLGHNGAGKTTLINILTGVISPDNDPQLEIEINNNPIDNIDQIRKYIGVCSQFDILWNQLTAQQHLYLFARLKGIPKNLINKRIDQMLGFVNLKPQKKARVKSFSGGMKRRLSLAIAAIGSPRIILLDQPTTGLDPKVRQQVWDLVQKLKANKSIILTTHSMQQADILADRISVMVKGKLKCVGTSFYLKNKYGQGHRITLNIDDRRSKQVFDIIKKLFPKAIQVDSKGGNLIVGLNDYQSLLDMIKMLQNQQSSGLNEYTLKQAIKDWSVSHSTLQEVFMKVTRQKEE